VARIRQQGHILDHVQVEVFDALLLKQANGLLLGYDREAHVGQAFTKQFGEAFLQIREVWAGIDGEGKHDDLARGFGKARAGEEEADDKKQQERITFHTILRNEAPRCDACTGQVLHCG